MIKKSLVCLLAFVLLCAGHDYLRAQDKGEAASKPVKAIDWNELASVLPEQIEGLKTGELDGGTFTMGDPNNPGQQVSYSSVQRTYTEVTSDDEPAEDGEYSEEEEYIPPKEITISIMDSGLSELLRMPYFMMMEYDSPDGSMKSVQVKGHEGKRIIEKVEGQLNSIQLMVLISNRVLVTVDGNERTTVDEITGVAQSIDLDKLVKLSE